MTSHKSQVTSLKPHYLLLTTCYLLLATVFTSCPQDPAFSLFKEAEDTLARGLYQKAIEDYKAVVDKYPGSPYAPQAQYKIGLIYHLFLRDARKAREVFTALLLIYPSCKEVPYARRAMAEIYTQLGDYQKAIGEYEELVKTSWGEERDMFRYEIAEEYLRLNDIRQARIELQELLRDSPFSEIAPQAYHQIAHLYHLEGNLQEAIKAYDKVIQSYPYSPYSKEAIFEKATLLEETGNLREALTLYEKLKGVYPNQEALQVRLVGVETRIREFHLHEGERGGWKR